MMSRLTVSLLAAAFGLATAAHAGPADEAAITKLEKDLAASQSAEAVLAFLDKDVVFEDMVTPAEFKGIDEMRKNVTDFFNHYSNLKVEFVDLKAVGDGKLGWAASIQHMTAKGKNGAPDLDTTFRDTDLLQKKAGKWVVVYQHFSVPYDPATGKAVLTGK